MCIRDRANNQNPNLNWGYTDFMDAAIAGSGLVFNPKIAFYHAGSLRDGDGDSLPGTNKLSLTAFSPQLIYVGKTELPGHLKWGAQMMGTIVSLNADSSLGLEAGNGMLGDLCFGPFVGRAHSLAKDWTFHWFGEFDIYAPIGSYDEDAAFNAGANFWTFEPFVAMTLQMPHGFEFSTRQHLTFNTRNNDYVNPGVTGDFAKHDLKAGELWHFNWTLSKSLDFISPMLRLGAVGYYGQQLSNDEVDGDTLSDSKERVLGIGPGLQYVHIPKGAKAPSVIFNLKSYWETVSYTHLRAHETVLDLVCRLLLEQKKKNKENNCNKKTFTC